MRRPGPAAVSLTRFAERVLHRAPRGATAVLVAICLVMLCSFLALALNVGHLLSIRGELQNAADSAALAGAQDLNGTLGPVSGSPAPAVMTAQAFAKRHATDSDSDKSIELTNDDVELGFWDHSEFRVVAATEDTASCSKLDAAGKLAPCINAVRVKTNRDTAHKGEVPIAFGSLLGKLSSTVGAEAIAVTGGPCGMKCIGLPIVLPDCGVDPFLLATPCKEGLYTVLFSSDRTDTGAWADLGAGASTVKCLIEESIEHRGVCPTTSRCTVNSTLAVDADMDVIGGELDSACKKVYDAWDSDHDRAYVVPVVDAACAGEKWVTPGSDPFTIVKFVSVQIARPPNCKGADKSFDVRVLCNETTDQSSEGGCIAAGTWVRPGLVK